MQLQAAFCDMVLRSQCRLTLLDLYRVHGQKMTENFADIAGLESLYQEKKVK